MILALPRFVPFVLAGSSPVLQAATAASDDKDKDAYKPGPHSDMTDYGIDRSNPENAPSTFTKWHEYGTTGRIAADGWKEWSDLPAPYKYYQVKVNPKDVEAPNFFLDLLGNYKTAVPLSLVVAFPFLLNGTIVMDEHFELGAIFFTVVYMLSGAVGDGVRDAVLAPGLQARDQLLAKEKAYREALGAALKAHQAVQNLPEAALEFNQGVRALRHEQAAADTRRARAAVRGRYVDMLEFMVTSAKASGEDDGAALVTNAAVADVTEQLVSGKGSLSKVVLADAIAALKSGKDGTKSLREATKVAFFKAQANPPKLDDAAERKERRQKQVDTFKQRFGFSGGITEKDIADL